MSELLASIAYHAALGLLLAALVWGVGLGATPFLRNGQTRREAVHAYPVGLLLVILCAFLVLVQEWLWVVVAPFLIVLLRRGLRRRPRPMNRSLGPLPALLCFAGALGYLLHGPTADLDSSAYGDLLFFAGKLVSATESVVPFRDLLADGQSSTYVEGATSWIGGALTVLPGFDALLFQTTTLPAFMLASVVVGFSLLDVPRPDPRLALVAAFATAMVAYPTWLTESPPATLALPLAFSIFLLTAERASLRVTVAVAAAIALDLVLSKGFALVPFGLLLAIAFRRDHWPRLDPRRRAVLLAGLLACAGAGLALFLANAGWLAELLRWNTLPADAVRGLRHQLDDPNARRLAPAAEILGHTALAVALLRVRAYALAAAMAASMLATWFVGGEGFDFDIATAIVILIAAIRFASRPADVARAGAPLVAAAVLLPLATLLREILGVRIGFALVSLLALTLVLALPVTRLRARVLIPATAAAGLALFAFATTVSRGDTLTTADYDIWHRVHDVVPEHALVFTSLTGPEITGDQGWNYYPGVAGRQLYLAGWYDSILLAHEDERRRRLALNAGVISGRLSPDALALSRPYVAYYAVLRRRERAPGGFRRVYANPQFALYRIES